MSEQARMMTIEFVQVRADCAQRAFVWHLDISSTSLLHPSLHICSSGERWSTYVETNRGYWGTQNRQKESPPNNRRPQNSRSPPSRSRRTVSGLAHPGIGGVVTQPRLPGHVEPLPVALPPQRVLIARGGAPKNAALASRRERAHSPSAFARQFKLFSRAILVQYASRTRAHRIHARTHARTQASKQARTQASKQASKQARTDTHAHTQGHIQKP